MLCPFILKTQQTRQAGTTELQKACLGRQVVCEECWEIKPMLAAGKQEINPLTVRHLRHAGTVPLPPPPPQRGGKTLSR